MRRCSLLQINVINPHFKLNLHAILVQKKGACTLNWSQPQVSPQKVLSFRHLTSKDRSKLRNL
jgi:hypothetical protein